MKNERQRKAWIGLSTEAFEQRLKEFACSLEAIKNEDYRKTKRSRRRRPGGGRKGTWVTPENKLFLILYSLKNYPTLDVLGCIFGLSLSKAEETVPKLIPVLKRARDRLQVLPKRAFKEAEEFSQVLEKKGDILIDVTDREHFRHPD